MATFSTGLSESNLVTQSSNSAIFYDPQNPDATCAEEVRRSIGAKRSAENLSAANLEPTERENADTEPRRRHQPMELPSTS